MERLSASRHFEVELKYREVDHTRVAAALRALGADERPLLLEVDTYLAHPVRDFKVSGEVFRIRASGSEVLLSYKGPKLGGAAKAREEIEAPCAATAATLLILLERLGFRTVRAVEKRRIPFSLDYRGRGMTVVLDTVEDLGAFVEVETLADGPDDIPVAQAAVTQLAEALGLSHVDPRSYLRMLLERDDDSASL